MAKTRGVFVPALTNEIKQALREMTLPPEDTEEVWAQYRDFGGRLARSFDVGPRADPLAFYRWLHMCVRAGWLDEKVFRAIEAGRRVTAQADEAA